MLRYILLDNESLEQYLSGNLVSFDDIKRRLLLKQREKNPEIPDHLYRLAQQSDLRRIESIGELFTVGLPEFSHKYLEIEGAKIFVRSNMQNNWQELLTYFPPLLLQGAFLCSDKFEGNFTKKKLHKFFKDVLFPNTQYTSIPSPQIVQLDYFVRRHRGLHDLHMHLNGSLETDQVWQDFLFNPNEIYEYLKKGFGNPIVREQLEQESRLLQPYRYISMLKIAQRLRQFFFEYLFNKNNGVFSNKRTVLIDILNNHSKRSGSYKHPFLQLVSVDRKFPHLMSVEGLMYILLINDMKKNSSDILPGLFHFYLLILGLTNRLLVHQTHQKGFQQFQKHTLNELRGKSEKLYMRRFHQMNGNNLTHLRFLEGRFSPKKSQKQMISFIDLICRGWNALTTEMNKKNGPQTNPHPELRLVAHFIKRPDTHPDSFIRHKNLRYDIFKRARVLSLILKKYPKYRNRVTGIDAAASEFDARPEVYGPVFRYLRRSGMKHFTFHAGEDFYHIIDGLRAIYEAIVFCDLKNGDRIGHATAVGLDAKYWGKIVGDKLLIRQGDYLDNLVFCYSMIIKRRIESLNVLIPTIINEVDKYCFKIYNRHYSIDVLESAWLMRQCCPSHALEAAKSDLRLKPIYNEEEWNFLLEKGFVENRNEIRNNNSWKIFRMYHDYTMRKKFDEIITIDPFGILSESQIECLQHSLLHEMTEREIVIETLPTSNVRIGFHRSFNTYHLTNWLKWRSEGKCVPPIVVGSDDTGIFATNIYNEYANIYCMLLKSENTSHEEVMDIIKSLDENSKIYRFG